MPGAGAGAPGARGGSWLISMVPLNLGAAAPLRLKPHLTHVDAASEFCVPQLGQNTQHLPHIGLIVPWVAGAFRRAGFEWAQGKGNVSSDSSPEVRFLFFGFCFLNLGLGFVFRFWVWRGFEPGILMRALTSRPFAH